MNPVLLRLLASLKVVACIGVGSAGTVGVQRWTASHSPQEIGQSAVDKENGKGMKFEINQPSKQLDEKEQSLNTERKLLAKQKAELEERLASTAQTQIVTTVATTVAETKREQPIIDDVPFGEEEKRKAREVKSFDLAPTRNYETS